MKITRTVERVVEVEEIDDILCNKCGRSCQKGDPDFGKSPYGLIEGCVEGGYHSEALSDMTSYVFSFCEECLKVLFDACAIPPLVRSDGETLLYDPNWKENSKKRYESWKENLRAAVEPLLPATPLGWVREFDGQHFIYSEARHEFIGADEKCQCGALCDADGLAEPCAMSPTITFWRLEDHFHITICQNHGETPISREDVERIRALFIPEIPLDPNLKGVEIYKAGTRLQERAVGDDPISIATFTKALR